MAKFCSNCGKEIDNNAAICLNCGVVVDNREINNVNKIQEKKKGLPTWAIILIVVGCTIILPILLITVIAVFTFNAISSTDVENIIEEIITTQNGSVGDTLISEDFQITLTDTLTYDIIGTEDNKEVPKEGKEFLVLFFDIKNITDETKYISAYDFDGYLDDYTINNKYLSNNINNIEELGVNLAPGKKTRGYIAYEVEKEWQEFTICYEDIFEDNKIVFTVTNDNNLKDNNNITGA